MKLGDLAEVQMGYPFRSRLEHDPQGEVAVIQMKDIDDANLLHAESAIRLTLPKGKTKHLLRTDDLIFRSRGRSNCAARVQKDIGAAVLAAPMLIIRPHGVLPEYLRWFINTPATQAQLTAVSEGTSVRMISVQALRNLAIPIPPLNTQQLIVRVADLSEHEHSLLMQISELRQHVSNHQLMQIACGTKR